MSDATERYQGVTEEKPFPGLWALEQERRRIENQGLLFWAVVVCVSVVCVVVSIVVLALVTP